MDKILPNKLKKLYIGEKLSTYQIANRKGIKFSPRQIYDRLKKHGTKIRTQSEAARIRQGKNPNLTPSKDLFYILGVLFGDGHITGEGEIRFNVTNKKFAKEFRSSLKKLDFEPAPITEKETPHKKQYCVIVKSSVFKDWLKEKTDSINNYRTDKNFLDFIKSKIYDKKEYCKGFIKGIYESDGTYSGKTLRIYSTKKKVANLIKEAIEYLGFETSKTSYQNPKSYSDTPTLKISILNYPKDHKKFIEKINPVIKKKTEKVNDG